MTSKQLAQGHLLSFFTVLIWSTTFVSTKVLLRTLLPIEILFLRFVLGYCALWLVMPRRLRPAERRQELYFAAAGLCGVTLYFLMENVALTHTTASNVAIILATAPFFTAICDRVFLAGKSLSKRFFLGFVIAIAGIWLISFQNGGAQLHLQGDMLAVGAAMVWACYSTIVKKISAFGYSTIQTTRRCFGYGLLLMLPVLPLMGFRFEWARIALPVNLSNLIFLGLGASALCFVTWNVAVRLIGTVKSGVYIYATPAITAVASSLVLDEVITPVMVLGIVLVLTGLMISQTQGRRRAAPQAAAVGK